VKKIQAFLCLLTTCFTLFTQAVGAVSRVRCEAVLHTVITGSAIHFSQFDPQDSWGRQIFSYQFSLTRDFYNKTRLMDDETRLNTIFSDDIRAQFFQLQSLARMYSKMDPNFFSPYHVKFKEVEDRIGYLDLQKKLKSKAVELDYSKLIRFFSAREEAGKKRLKESLSTWDEKGIASLENNFRNFDGWSKGRADFDFLVSRIIEDIEVLDQEVKAMRFDQADIEKGLHQLRRRLRWIVIQVLSLNNMVEYFQEPSLTREVKSWFLELKEKTPDILNNKYMHLDPVVVNEPVQIPVQMHGILTQIVADIGGLKDGSEVQIEFTNAINEIGYSPKKAKEIMAKLNSNLGLKTVDHQKLAREYQNRLNETNLLLEYARAFKRSNP
jgi:hypothetical protein